MYVIKDGTGTGNTLEIDSSNRAQTYSTSPTLLETALTKGLLFVTSTATMELTADTASAVIYVKNNSGNDVLFPGASLILGPSTDGSGIIEYGFLQNPTGGTIITDETEAGLFNANGSSTISLDADAYLGGEGKTVTGTSFTTVIPHANDTYVDIFSEFILSTGSSIAVTIKPPSGNTSMKLTLGLKLISLNNV